jgi:hypothetical protein
MVGRVGRHISLKVPHRFRVSIDHVDTCSMNNKYNRCPCSDSHNTVRETTTDLQIHRSGVGQAVEVIIKLQKNYFVVLASAKFSKRKLQTRRRIDVRDVNVCDDKNFICSHHGDQQYAFN